MNEVIHNFISHDFTNALLIVVAAYAILLLLLTMLGILYSFALFQFLTRIQRTDIVNYIRSTMTKLNKWRIKLCLEHGNALILIALTISLFAVPYLYNNHPKTGSWLLGDVKNLENLFAPAAALFSGIAFLFMYRTLKSQETQLGHMRQESIDKSFETVFFNLLQMHRENHARLTDIHSTKTPSKKLPSSRYFKRIHRDLHKGFSYQQDVLSNTPPQTINSSAANVSTRYKKIFRIIDQYLKTSLPENKKMAFYKAVFEMKKHEFTSYFRHYYHTLKYLHTAYKNKKINHSLLLQYRDMLKAQLSPHEHAVLYYNGLYFKNVMRKSGYYEMISELKMLDDIDCSLLFDKGCIGNYPPSAFGGDKHPKWECYNDD